MKFNVGDRVIFIRDGRIACGHVSEGGYTVDGRFRYYIWCDDNEWRSVSASDLRPDTLLDMMDLEISRADE